MNRRTKLAVGGLAVVAAIGATTGMAVASSDDDASETPITGDARQKAEDAALQHTGGGTVTGTELDEDGESYYEVEVTSSDGNQVDVELDENFQVVGSEADAEDDG